MSDLAFRIWLGVVFVVVTVGASLGIGARATYGAQTTADEPQYLLSATSLWEDVDLDISDELADERYRVYHETDLPQQTRLLEDGRRVSPHGPLLPLLLAVPVGFGGWVGAKLALAAMAGALAAALVWIAHHRLGVAAPVAIGVVAVFALSPPLAVYGTQVYPEIPAALVVTAGLAALLGPPGQKPSIVVLLAVVALPWLAVKYVPVAGVLAVAGLVRSPTRMRVGFVTVLVVAGVVHLISNAWIYGGMTPYAAGDHFVGGEMTAVGTQVDLWGRSSRLVGLMVDAGFGIGAWQPAYLLTVPAGAWALARRLTGSITLLALAGTGWLVATFVALTMHGWWFPGRQVIVILPAIVLLIASWADRPHRAALTLVPGALGMVAYGYLVAEGLGERLTWVVDFGATADPIHRALGGLMPDYMASSFPWLRHTVWAAAFAVVAVAAWLRESARSRAVPERPSRPATPELIATTNDTRS